MLDKERSRAEREKAREQEQGAKNEEQEKRKKEKEGRKETKLTVAEGQVNNMRNSSLSSWFPVVNR